MPAHGDGLVVSSAPVDGVSINLPGSHALGSS